MTIESKWNPDTSPSSAPSPNPLENRQLIGLDLIRFSAALLVVAYHVGFFTNRQHPGRLFRYTQLEPYAVHGFVGVDIFFVLSGFVIAFSANRSTALRFAKSRFLRLFPAVWICSTCTLLVTLYGPVLRLRQVYLWLNSIVLSPIGPWIDSSYWTLGIEMSFYALLCLLLLSNRFSYLAPCMTLLTLLSSASLLYGDPIHRWSPTTSTLGANVLNFLSSRLAELLLLRHASLFAFGVFLWVCFDRGFTSLRVAGLMLTFAGSLLTVYSRWLVIVIYVGYKGSCVPSLLIWLLAMIAIVLSVAFNKPIARLVGPRGAQFARSAGLATYPLYLIHQEVGDILIHHLYPRVPYPLAIALCVGLLVAFSFAVVPCLERPLQNFLRRVLHAPGRPPQPTASLP